MKGQDGTVSLAKSREGKKKEVSRGEDRKLMSTNY